jgi:peptidoglycan hydrolase-like protein with peptidoglycan-binding domain
MKNALLLFLGGWMATSLWADDLTRAIQQRLKDQGFYYGEVNGQRGDETSAAIRRYQIRHGLKVSGQLNDETLHSLGMSRNDAAQPTPGFQENGGSPKGQANEQYYRQPPGQTNEQYYRQPPGQTDEQYYRQPPGQTDEQYYRQPPGQTDQQYYRQPSRQYDGQPFPQSEGPEEYNQMQPPRFVAPRVVTSLPQLFGGTIYERSPAQIQENVLYAVQGELMRRGFFRGDIDGRLGPATSEAILRLQQEEGLPMSGRLDNETLNDLKAFPGQHNGPPEERFRQRPGGERFYRGFAAPF